VNSGFVSGTQGLNIATVNVFSPADSAVQADVNLTGARVEFAGLVSRYGGPGEVNMYWAGLNNNTGQVQAQIWRNVGGTWVQLTAQNVAGTGGTIRLETASSSLKLFLNDNLVGFANDHALNGGSVGIRMTPGTTLARFSATAINLTSPGLPFSDNFSTAVDKQLSNNWLNQLGNFQVQGGMASGFGGLNIATVNGVNTDDVFVQADVNVSAGQFGGLVAHYSGPQEANMYWAGINANAGTFQAQIWRNLNGAWTQLFAQNVASGSGTLRFEVLGSSLKLFDGGNLVAFANDSFVTGGTVGMRGTFGATLTNFTTDVLAKTNNMLPFADNFNTATNQQLSLSWLNQLGNFQVSGGTANAFGSLDVATVNGISATNVFVQADVTVGAGQFAGLVAHFGGPSMYWAGINTNTGTFQAQIWSNIGGTWTELYAQNAAGGLSTLRFEVVGSSLKLFQNSNLVAFANDSILTGGTIGMRATAGAIFDNFSADVLTLNNPGLSFSDNFNSANNQQLSNSWLNQLGNFQVAGGVATALANLNIATVNGVSVTSSTVRADVTVSTGGFAGLVSRYSGPGEANMYWAGLSNGPSGTFAQIWVNVGGNWTLLANQLTASKTATLELVTNGSTLSLFLNNNSSPTLQVTDSSITSAGAVGMRGSAGATFDNFFASSP
jgi:hypothetical protein